MRQATDEEIGAVVLELEKEAKADRIVRDAMEAEAIGKGNAFTAYLIKHGRLPGPKEAHRIAMETGMHTPDRDCQGNGGVVLSKL
jgi:hypothetical protein